MKNIFIFCLIILSNVIIFSQGFESSTKEITKIATTLQNELVFTEELYDLNNGETWGLATYIPLNETTETLMDFLNEKGISGILVFKITIEPKQVINITGNIKINGRSEYYEEVREGSPEVYFLDDNSFMHLYHSSYGNFNISTSEEYIILFLNTSSLLNNYDYVMNLNTSTSISNWQIRKKGLEYKKFKEIMSNLGY